MYLLALLVAALWSIYPFILKKVTSVNYIVIWMIMSIVTAVVSVFVTCMMGGFAQLSKLKTRDLKLICLSSIIGPVCAFLLYFYLLQTCRSVSLVITLAFTSPVFAAIIAYFWANEQLTIIHIIGIILICIGITCVLTKK